MEVSDRDTIYGFGQHYNDGSGTYARNPPSQLSANSDSNGNNIPYGEWHKIYMPNSIILRTVNIAARNQNASAQGAPSKFSIYGSNNNSVWTLLASFDNEDPAITTGHRL